MTRFNRLHPTSSSPIEILERKRKEEDGQTHLEVDGIHRRHRSRKDPFQRNLSVCERGDRISLASARVFLVVVQKHRSDLSWDSIAVRVLPAPWEFERCQVSDSTRVLRLLGDSRDLNNAMGLLKVVSFRAGIVRSQSEVSVFGARDQIRTIVVKQGV